ncbi:MAG TPA: Gfo/Idh/MocA family oxidoreductase [Vicinamibacterales bacterium]|nr:Gfo/Idh/MocA family oxidoreductase [Vicinamibacterales bacterium]
MTNRSNRRVSRRGFLQATGGTLAATSLTPLTPGPLAAQVPDIKLPAPPEKQVGFALVGLGNLAINQLMPAFGRSRLAKLVGFVSGRPEKARQLAQLYGVDAKNIYSYDNYERIADNPAIDVIYVVLPNSMHAEYTIRALKAGKHVLCEKPMATTPQDCEQMIAAAKAATRKLMVGYRVRYEPFNQALIAYARETAEAGPTRLILADAGFNIGDPKQWRLRKQMAGGGSLMDIGIYALNAARYLSGEEPVAVNAMMHSTPNDPRFVEVEENITFQLRFPSGILANCASSYGGGVNRHRVIKPRGAAELEPASSYTGLRMRVFRGGAIEERNLPQRDHFASEMDHFAECILKNTEPLTPGEEGLKDLKVITAIYEAARTGRTVMLG